MGALRAAGARGLAQVPRPTPLLRIFLATLGAYSVGFNLQGLGLLRLDLARATIPRGPSAPFRIPSGSSGP